MSCSGRPRDTEGDATGRDTPRKDSSGERDDDLLQKGIVELISFNLQGLSDAKRTILEQGAWEANTPPIIALQETHLLDRRAPELWLRGYVPYHQPRTQHGGGVLLLIRSDLMSEDVPGYSGTFTVTKGATRRNATQRVGAEWITRRVFLTPTISVRVCSLYISPNCVDEALRCEDLLRVLKDQNRRPKMRRDKTTH
ncbi:MAG: hypothetical protein D6722_04095 [Bacteroidetes bacterium]|nr:MAG: hypothetical protein D6722_04095 [Bacteroidota bacterium]